MEEIFNNFLEERHHHRPASSAPGCFEAVCAEILGYGPIEPLLEDDSITEIMVNGPKQVYIERDGQAGPDRRQVPGRRACDARSSSASSPRWAGASTKSSPYVDARLPDGSRVNAVIPPHRAQRAR